MIPQQPLIGKFETTPKPNSVWISQGYGVAFSAYKGGFHLGIDLVPLDFTTKFYPAITYAILPATVRYFYEELNGKNSKCLVLDTWLDDNFIFYLKSLNQIPSSYTGKVRLMHT